MSISVLDTVFESELRALIFLFLTGEPADADYLGALDTLTINQRNFGIGATNLNGTHRLASGELHTRTSLMHQALKQLTLQGLATFDSSTDPVGFQITDEGASVVNRMRTDYANRFFNAVLDTLEAVGDATTAKLTRIIHAATPVEGVS